MRLAERSPSYMPLHISNRVVIPDEEINTRAIRAQGAGGQHVNKVSSAIHLQFDSQNSSLPDVYKQAVLTSRDRRVSRDGTITIKAQRFRSQDRNREDAFDRLADLLRNVYRPQKKRVATRPGKAARKRRMDSKTKRGAVKAKRGKVKLD